MKKEEAKKSEDALGMVLADFKTETRPAGSPQLTITEPLRSLSKWLGKTSISSILPFND